MKTEIALAIGILAFASIPAAAQGAKQACMRCTALCNKCGWTNKCVDTCNKNGNPMVTGPCKDWFDACKK